MQVGAEELLNALHRFDVKLAEQANGVQNAVDGLAAAANNQEEIGPLLDTLDDTISELTALFQKRDEAILDPTLLTNSGYAPDVPIELMRISGEEGTSES